MCCRIRNVLSKTALLSLVITLTLGLNSAQAMDNERSVELPDEVLVSIFKKNPTIKDLGRYALVSHQWNAVSSYAEIWEETARDYEQSGGNFSRNVLTTFLVNSSWKIILRESFQQQESAPATDDDTAILMARLRNAGRPKFQEIKDFKLKSESLLGCLSFEDRREMLQYFQLFAHIQKPDHLKQAICSHYNLQGLDPFAEALLRIKPVTDIVESKPI